MRRGRCGDWGPAYRWRADRRGAFGADAPSTREGHRPGARRSTGGPLARVPLSPSPPRPAGQTGSDLSTPAEGDLRTWMLLASARGLQPNDDSENACRLLAREIRTERGAGPSERRRVAGARLGSLGRVGMRDLRPGSTTGDVVAVPRLKVRSSRVGTMPLSESGEVDAGTSRSSVMVRIAARTRSRKIDSPARGRSGRKVRGTRSDARWGRPEACRR